MLLLAEDVMEDVKVVADEEQEEGFSQELVEKTVEEQGLQRLGSPSECLALDELQALASLQVELSSRDEVNCWASVRFTCMNHLSRKRHLARRSAIIQGMRGLWARDVFYLLLLSVRLLGGGDGGGGASSGAESGGCEGDRGGVTGRVPEAPEGSVVQARGMFQRHS